MNALAANDTEAADLPARHSHTLPPVLDMIATAQEP